jgi:hypothetical protein
MNTEIPNEKLAWMKDDALIDLRDRIDQLLCDREREYLRSKKMTREQLIKLYEGFGYVVSKGSKFWRVTGPGEEHRGYYGLQVGQYTHECYIDTTDMIVLLIIDLNSQSVVEKFAELWLTDCVTV